MDPLVAALPGSVSDTGNMLLLLLECLFSTSSGEEVASDIL